MTKTQDKWARGIAGTAKRLLDTDNKRAKANAARYVKKWKK